MVVLRDPFVNALQAVIISSNATNWAAWDVAYAAGERLRRVDYLPYLEIGSAAWNELPTVNAVLAGSSFSTPQERANAPTEPGVSLASDILAAPDTPAYVAPDEPSPQPTPPQPYTPPPLNLTDVEVPRDDFDGFDNVTRYWKRDLPYLNGIDKQLIDALLDLEGDAPWQR